MQLLPLMSLRSNPVSARRGLHITIALLAVIALIAMIDYASGMAVAISVLYLIPIIASGWLLRPGRAAAVAVVASIGVAHDARSFPFGAGELLSRADAAMYEAKRGGKGRVVAEVA